MTQRSHRTGVANTVRCYIFIVFDYAAVINKYSKYMILLNPMIIYSI